MAKASPTKRTIAKGRRVPAGPNQVARLEELYGKIGALLHATDQQDGAIRTAAIALHDQANAQIAKAQQELERQYPDVDPQLARDYAQLLQQRKRLQATILKDRERLWEQGPRAGV